MVDTGFQTRADNVHRLAAIYADDGRGGLKPATEAFDMPINDFTKAPPNHSPQFDIDEDQLPVGARSLAALAVDFLKRP